MDLSTGDFLLTAFCVGVYYLAKTVPIPPSVVQAYRDGNLEPDRQLDFDDASRRTFVHDFDDDNDPGDSFLDIDDGIHPAVNVDGTPMMNDYCDVNGNPFGMCD